MSKENDYLIQHFFESLVAIIAMMSAEMFSEEVWKELNV